MGSWNDLNIFFYYLHTALNNDTAKFKHILFKKNIITNATFLQQRKYHKVKSQHNRKYKSI